MDKFNITRYKEYSELPLDIFNQLSFSVYVIDHAWNYLFVNNFVVKTLGEKGTNLVGKNMWEQFEELATDPSFMQLRKNTEKGMNTDMITTSPITSKRLHIIGRPLKDCYFFSSSILPYKDDLISELRNELGKAAL